MTWMHWMLIAAMLVMVAYEFYVVFWHNRHHPEAKLLTITGMIQRVSAKTAAVPFGFGLLMGHFFLTGRKSYGVGETGDRTAAADRDGNADCRENEGTEDGR